MKGQSRWLSAVVGWHAGAVREAMALLTFLCLCFVMPAAALAQIVLTDLVPSSGAVRTEVVLSGSGLDAGATRSITVNGVAAAILNVTPTAITFAINPGTNSGPVVLRVDGTDFIHPQPFTVTRMVSGTLQLPPGVNPAGYSIGSSAAFVDPAAGSGTFRIAVSKGRPTLLMAFRQSNDPVFMAVVTGVLQNVTIDATSTAIALAFLSPALSTRVESVARQRLAAVASLGEVATLAERITSLSRSGRNYLDDARVTTALLSVLQAAIASLADTSASVPSAFKEDPDAPADVLLKDLHPGGARGLRLATKILKTDAQHREHYRLKFDSAGAQNPLDWLISLYRLEPRQFPRGQFDVDRLSAFHTPVRLSNEPVDTAFVHAQLVTAYADIIEVIASKLLAPIFSVVDGDDADALALPKDTPGVYMSRAFSGNVCYGIDTTSTRLLCSPNQADLLNRLGGGKANWRRALAGNAAIAVIDLASVVLDVRDVFKALGGKKETLGKIMLAMLADMDKAIALHLDTPDGLTIDAMKDILKAGVLGFVKGVLGEITSANEDDVDFTNRLRRWTSGTLVVLASVIDAFGKVSAVGQVFERTDALLTSATYAVESSVVIVGHPFEPVIRSFDPREGNTNTLVTIEGFNFPPAPVVSFCRFLTTTPPGEIPVPDVTIPAPLIASSPSRLVISVPDNWESQVGPNQKTFLCVENPGVGLTSTRDNAEPYRRFTFLDTPEVLGVDPDPALSLSMVRIIGKSFATQAFSTNVVLVDGGAAAGGHTLMALGGSRDMAGTPNDSSDDVTDLYVVLPNLTPGEHTIAVRVNNETSAAVPFTVVLRADNTPAGGLIIEVTTLSMDNTPDGEISMLEAFLLANGTLGRPVSRHEPCEFNGTCPPQKREEDHIQRLPATDNGGGPLSRDTVQLARLLSGTIFLTAPLPPVSSGDSFFPLSVAGRLIFDGSGIVGSTEPGLLFDGVTGVTMRNITLRNFPGHGVHLRGGAQGNVVSGVSIENAGLSGFYLEGDAQHNFFEAGYVAGCGRHGIHLSGPDVRLNTLALVSRLPSIPNAGINNCAGNGVRIDDGAQANLVRSDVLNSGAAGILITGEASDGNVIGLSPTFDPALGVFVIPFFQQKAILNNNGPGIHLTAGVEHTAMKYLNVAGNQGDGIVLEGPGTAHNQVEGIFTGVDLLVNPANPPPLPNQGSGIHLLNGAQYNLLGTRRPGSGGFEGRSFITGNRDDGVLLEGPDTHSNIVNRMHIGALPFTAAQPYQFPNGANGIHIRDGSHDNMLGDRHSFQDLHIYASVGAGILIEGVGSDNNRIAGNQIGGDHEFSFLPPAAANRIGIHLRDGVRGTVIGEMGDFLEPDPAQLVYRSHNVIANCTEAGIVIENAGGQLVNGRLLGANSVQNNKIGEEDFGASGPNASGILITADAVGNIIGGNLEGQGNRIVNNTTYGLEMVDNTMANLPLALHNRFANNLIQDTGSGVSGGDVCQAPAGVSISDSSGNVFGEDRTTPNLVQRNAVGIVLKRARADQVYGNQVTENNLAGIAICNAENVTIGGLRRGQGNVVYANGNDHPNGGGIVLAGGREHTVQGNIIGDDGQGVPGQGNRGQGLIVRQSSDNFVADNVIADNTLNGVRLTGARSTGNHLARNLIGTDRSGNVLGNGMDGIRLEAGAANNLIGGTQAVPVGAGSLALPAPNRIHHNAGDGVEVNGAATTGNTILFNSITANAKRGIRNAAGGNFVLPPPGNLLLRDATLRGRVDQALLPSGSTVQVFADAGTQGDVFLGEGTVQDDGTFIVRGIAPPPVQRLNLTVTHAAHGSTSEFGASFEVDAEFRVASAPLPPSSPPPRPGVPNVPVLPLQVSTRNADVVVTSMQFRAAGTLQDATDVVRVRLYHDTDVDGLVSAADVLLGGPAKYDADDGSVTVPLDGAVLSTSSSQRWLLVYTLAASAPAGSSFSVRLVDTSAVTARTTFPVGAQALPTGSFPITSKTFTVGAAAPRIVIAQSGVDFAQVPINTNKNKRLTIRNNGQATLEVLAFDGLGRPFRLLNPTVPFTVAPGQAIDIVIRFRPDSVGIVEQPIVVRSNDPDTLAVTVVLRGEGV